MYAWYADYSMPRSSDVETEFSLWSQTAINAYQAVATADREMVQPTVQRKQQIDDFTRKHKVDVSLSKFYASQFSMSKA